MDRKCICNLCSCGRHRCPHLPTKIYEKTEEPCFFSEYTEKYSPYHCFAPRESFKPKAEYQKHTIPMEGLTTTKTDFKAYDTALVPALVKHQHHKFTAKEDKMDFLTTYNQHYNFCPVSRVSPIKPRDNNQPCRDKMDGEPTYKAHYLHWNQQKRPSTRPSPTYRPSLCRFVHRTTHQDDYPVKHVVATVSPKPPSVLKLCSCPMENTTSYKSTYVSYPLARRCVYGREKYKPSEVPFDDLTTHRDSYKGLKGEPAKIWKPTSRHFGLDIPLLFNTEFRDKFQVWPTSQRVPKEPEPYIPPEGEIDLMTTAQADYRGHSSVPVQPCRPVDHLKKDDRFEGTTIHREDYKPCTTTRRELIKPAPQLKLSNQPMDCLTTNRAHYVPFVPVNTKSCKPPWSGPPKNIPLEGQTTYSTSFTSKGILRCPASYLEPPGYIFEEVDAEGHRMYRPDSQQSNHLGFDDTEIPKQRELAVPCYH
ncbi:stabilizer of axonemal microtubules 1-like [Meriones unguiculatus]|uniref:stabilizer of axonemal microtubules 1-like n=1 Tax=Meriones unguiculatus TaxID=10047 RepID=UPI000B4F2798|nr:stabilizer of axonemal microtubules 1-like [Meriones unguiculatus]XP_060231388.1 stabilizer of axonemal microtubules 1-like [Meriones unguiculatus]